jgi:hypothetical protein
LLAFAALGCCGSAAIVIPPRCPLYDCVAIDCPYGSVTNKDSNGCPTCPTCIDPPVCNKMCIDLACPEGQTRDPCTCVCKPVVCNKLCIDLACPEGQTRDPCTCVCKPNCIPCRFPFCPAEPETEPDYNGCTRCRLCPSVICPRLVCLPIMCPLGTIARPRSGINRCPGCPRCLPIPVS